MFIEQGYKGNLGAWNFLVIPILFILLMIFNYVSTMLMIDGGASVEESMQIMIDQMGKIVVLIILLSVFVVGILAIIFWALVINQQSLEEITTSRRKVDWKRVFAMFFFWGTISGAMILISVYFDPENYVYNLDWSKFLPLLAVALIMLPLQTSFEEYLFRSQMMQGLGIMAKTRWIPFIVSSVLFGLMHAANPEVEKLGMGIMVFYIGTGFLLGAMTLLDEGLELALGFHAANNIVAALLVTSTWTALQTDSIYLDVSQPTSIGLADLSSVIIGYPIILIILGKIYKWKNWKEKLFGRVLSKEEFLALEHSVSTTQTQNTYDS
ncbi:MAG: CPBP family intramembrane glutamic endopeptidase [Nonlabens sp.]